MSKKLSRSPEEYKVKAVHVHLAERINKERGVGHGFVAGERVPYVISKGQSMKVSENGVLPEEIESGKYVGWQIILAVPGFRRSSFLELGLE